MIVVNLQGGLGNQIFQYAFAYAVAQKTNHKFKLDISIYDYDHFRKYELHHFNLTDCFATKDEIDKVKIKSKSFLSTVVEKLTNRPTVYYKEKHWCGFDNEVFTVKGDIYYDGFWQNEKYFTDFRQNLTEIFTNYKLHEESIIYEEAINSRQSVSLHIRRGDYVTNEWANNYLGIIDLSYYRNAVSLIESRNKNSTYFIFSDDLPWATKNLDFIKNKTFVSLDKDVPDSDEIILMSKCRNNIIANSTFSWWGAWLNNHSNKTVIIPEHWTKDRSVDTKGIIAKSWICL